MTTKRGNLFLYLTLVCFLGLIAIFIVDGYMGLYDTVYVTAGEREQKIDSDVWRGQEKYGSTGANRGEKVFFRYEMDNRQFSSYATDIKVSVWRMQEKILDVTSQTMELTSFDKKELAWVVDTAKIMPSALPPEQRYEYTVVINRGEIERRVIVYVNPVPSVQTVPKPPRPVPAP